MMSLKSSYARLHSNLSGDLNCGLEPISGNWYRFHILGTTPFTVARDPQYLRTMLMLLLAASFFEGYDDNILALVPINIQDSFGLTLSQFAWMRFFIQLGAVIAFVVAASADWWGRRPILLWSIVGYTVFTGLTAFAWSVVAFTILQFCAKVFLASEYAVAVTMISEEFPPERRGRLVLK